MQRAPRVEGACALVSKENQKEEFIRRTRNRTEEDDGVISFVVLFFWGLWLNAASYWSALLMP